MNYRRRLAIFAVLTWSLIAGKASAQLGGVTISPSDPTTQSTIILYAGGSWSDACWREDSSAVTIVGTTITYEVWSHEYCGGCEQIWTLIDLQDTAGVLPEGDFTVLLVERHTGCSDSDSYTDTVSVSFTVRDVTAIRVPSEQPTIQAGIDAASAGDTVLVAPGTYTGDGNRDIDFKGKNIVVKSESGPEVTIIDCQGGGTEYHRGFDFHSGETTDAVVRGFTITNGFAYGSGGGISCRNSSPTIVGNIISGNQSYSTGFGGGASGGGIACSGSPAILNNMITNNGSWGAEGIGGDGGGISCGGGNPLLQNNIIAGNGAGWGGVHGGGGGNGGAIKCYGGSPTIIGNTIVANLAGGAFWVQATLDFGQSTPTLHSNIIAYNNDAAISGENVTIACTDIFGNTDGDWIGSIADQVNINGNFSLDPLFCSLYPESYALLNISPCAPENNTCEILIGASGVSCFVSRVVYHVAVDGDDVNGNGSPLKPFATIQAGIDAASYRDTVLVAPGTYTGEGNRDIDFKGKNIVVKSESGPRYTIIDCEDLGRGFHFHTGEDSTAVLEGFTITGGYATDGFVPPIIFGGLHRYGGAIFCNGAGPTIRGNAIYGNRTWQYAGGGETGGVGQGGGIGCYQANPHIIGNVVADNYSPSPGSGIASYESTPVITNTIVSDGMWNYDKDVPVPVVSYCNVYGGWEGEGNIDADPFFVAPYELYFNVCDMSPCIDAGDPSMTDPDGSRSDIGLYYSQHPACLYGTRDIWHISTSGNDIEGDGSAEFPFRFIQQGIRIASDGDTVLVDTGTYHENIDFDGKNVTVISKSFMGDMRSIPDNTIISGANTPGRPATVTIASGEGPTAELKGFMVKNGLPGIMISGSNPVISYNYIVDNMQGISCTNTAAILTNNVIAGNGPACGYDGGGIACYDSANVTVNNCTFVDNRVVQALTIPEDDCFDLGPAVYSDNSLPVFENCIIAYNFVRRSGEDIPGSLYGDASLSCCDIYPVDDSALITDTSRNFSADPIFCDMAAGNYLIAANSPCAPTNNDCRVLIGALGVGCTSAQIVYIDIKPGSCPNPLNAIGKGQGKAVLPGAILGTDDFDVREIDPESIMLNGVEPLRWSYEDVGTPVDKSQDSCACTEDGPDGYEDLTLKFNRQAIISSLSAAPGDQPEAIAGLAKGSAATEGDAGHDSQTGKPSRSNHVLRIEGQLNDGTAIDGYDCVVLLTKGEPLPIALDGTLRELELIGNHPNPFNPVTQISFYLPEAAHVTIDIFNIIGQRVDRVVDEFMEPGNHGVAWDGSAAASGVYFYQLEVGDFVESRKMLLLK